MRRFKIQIPKSDGGLELYPMKAWLKDHPTVIPAGMHPATNTSHELRNGLKKNGWQVAELADEVRLTPPWATLPDELISEVQEPTDSEDESDAAFASSFVLESHLRDFLAQNLNRIPFGDETLKLYVDPAGNDGIEYKTAVGYIDILAESSSGCLVVFELKRAASPDHAIGQLTRYMGWVKATIGRDRVVKGAIVAKEISDKLHYAVSVIPNVQLLQYELQFNLHPAQPLQLPSDSTNHTPKLETSV